MTLTVYFLREYLPYFRFAVMLVIFVIFAKALTKTELTLTITIAVISIGICYGILIASTTVSTVLIHLIFKEPKLIITTFITAVTQILSTIYLFKIKRFSKGIPFLRNRKAGVIGLFISGVVMLIFALINRGIPAEMGGWMITGTAVCITCFVIWWRRGMTAVYRKQLKDRNIRDYEKIIAEKEQQITDLREDNDTMAFIIHRDNKAIRGIFNATVKYVKSDTKSKEDGENIISHIEHLLKERSGSIGNYTYDKKCIPVIKDIIFEGMINHMMEKAAAEGIIFEAAEICDFVYQCESGISSKELHTVFADLADNAINSVRNSETKRIRVSYNLIDNARLLCVRDSGVPFEPATLHELGTKRTTTRSGEGGSGIGYMAVFDIKRKNNASLIITESKPDESGFTKSVSLHFDGKSRCILKTYRADEHKKCGSFTIQSISSLN